MSEQSKSNFQTFGAGLLGFVAVMAVGGGALMVHSSVQSKAAAKPAGAPIDMDAPASIVRPGVSASGVQRERRGESPAPLVGSEDEPEYSEESSAGGSDGSDAAASPKAASRGNSATSGLEVTRHLDVTGNTTSAKAVVKNTAPPEAAAKSAGKKAMPKLEATGAGPAAIASVHYGVTSRNELMGRAAGPVYNIKGGAGGGNSAGAGKMASSVKAQIADIERQLEKAGLTPQQRALLRQKLAEANKGISEAATAQ